MPHPALQPDAGGAAAAERAVVSLLARLAERPRAATARALVHHLATLTECAPATLPPGRRACYARLLGYWRRELAALVMAGGAAAGRGAPRGPHAGAA